MERLLGREHPDTITIVGNLACLYLAKDDYKSAEVLYLRKLKSREQLVGCDANWLGVDNRMATVI